jgi:predicted nucleotidyltransferase
MTTPSIPDDLVRQALQEQPDLAFAVLVGSRATGTQRPDSDWDIALQWAPTVDAYNALGTTETLRRQLAHALQQPATAVDLIDLRRANLAMRASVAEEGQALHIANDLAWAQFLERTWRELEQFEWEQRYAA